MISIHIYLNNHTKIANLLYHINIINLHLSSILSVFHLNSVLLVLHLNFIFSVLHLNSIQSISPCFTYSLIIYPISTHLLSILHLMNCLFQEYIIVIYRLGFILVQEVGLGEVEVWIFYWLNLWNFNLRDFFHLHHTFYL